MLINYIFILGSLLLNVSYADNAMLLPQQDYFSQIDDNIIHEGSLCEDKIKAMLSDMRSEVKMKLDTMGKNIPEMLEEIIIRKMYTLENKIPDRLEEYLDRKFYKLEKKIMDKLEEYMESKTNPVNGSSTFLENNTQNVINHKIDVLSLNIDLLVKKIPDLTILITLFNTLQKKITEPNCTKNASDEAVSLQNTSFQNNIVPHCTALNKSIHEVEVISRKLGALEEAIPNLEKNINHKLDILNGKVLDKLDEKLNKEFDAINNLNLTEFKHEAKNNERLNIIEALTKKIEEGVDNKLDVIQKKISDLKENINKFVVQQNVTSEKIFPRINNVTQDYLRCKELVVKGYGYQKPLFKIDSELFNNVQLNRTKNGELHRFGIHIAIKAAKDGLILLSPVPEPCDGDRVFEIGVGIGGNQQTDLRLNKMRNGIGYVSTPDILSITRYQPFYVRISNDKLEFGKEGQAAMLSYMDPILSQVKYLGFASWDNQEAKILYDCPEKPY